uniref:Xylose isomerase-like TIM barrel domain-containing protein n=1 Tax=viral metagenome TaxID=1070528 RepID=A0A6C0I2U3_9ZZZZ
MLGNHINRDTRHLSITSYIKETISDYHAHSLNMSTAAIFVSNPRGLQIILKDEEGEELKQFINKSKMSIIAHSSYVAFLWTKEKTKEATYLKFVLKELAVCKEYNISGLVIHLPKEGILKQKYIQKIMYKLINAIVAINASTTTTLPIIYLETPAIIPMYANYDTADKLSRLFHIIHKLGGGIGSNLFGLCIDTAHIWTSGNDISTYDGAKRWFTELMDAPYIPHDKIIIHLNDSERELGHGPDKHASLTKGKIWEKYQTRGQLKTSGLFFIMEFAKKYNIPLILERRNKEMLAYDYIVVNKLQQLL